MVYFCLLEVSTIYCLGRNRKPKTLDNIYFAHSVHCLAELSKKISEMMICLLGYLSAFCRCNVTQNFEQEIVKIICILLWQPLYLDEKKKQILIFFFLVRGRNKKKSLPFKQGTNSKNHLKIGAKITIKKLKWTGLRVITTVDHTCESIKH